MRPTEADALTGAVRLLRSTGLRVLGDVVQLEGPALRATAHLVALGASTIGKTEERTRTRHEFALMRVLSAAAEASAPVSPPRHDDVADPLDRAASPGPAVRVGSGQAAAVLGVSVKTVQRMAVVLGGVRRPGRAWAFDPDAVAAVAVIRRAALTDET